MMQNLVRAVHSSRTPVLGRTMLEWIPSPLRERLWAGKNALVGSLAQRGFVESLHFSLERQLIQMNIENVVDVGANRGLYGRLIRRIGFRGRILSFEPVEDLYRSLCGVAAADSSWETYRYALGDVDQMAMQMNVMASDVFSSLLAPSEAGRALFRDDIEVSRIEEVQIRRADAVLPELLAPSDLRRTHVKVDTQGFDRRVLSGFGAMISQVQSLQIEVSLVALYEGADDSLAHVVELMQSGYCLTAFVPVARDKTGRILEADALFRRVT